MRTIGTLFIALLSGISCLYAQNAWQPVPMPTEKQISSFGTSADGDLFSANNDGIFRLTNEHIWTKVLDNIYGSINSFSTIYQQEHPVILAATLQGGILRSEDNGANWATANKGLGTLHVNTIYQLQDGAVLAGTSYGGVYRSEDGGKSWVQIGMEGEHVTGFTQTRDGKVLLSSYRGVFVSDNGHNPWKESMSGLTNRVVECLLAAPNGALLAGCYNVGPCAPGGMFKSDDNGASWSKIGFENQHVKTLSSTPQGIFAGTWCGGVFRSVDNGQQWITLNDGLNEQCIQGLGITNNGVLYAGCYGALNTTSMYKVSLEQKIIAGESTSLPVIEEVSPNPVNGSAKIRFSLAEKSLVSLRIVNSVGEVFATLINELKPAGTYTAEWDASQIENGMYVVRIQVGNQVQTVPVVVIK